MHKLSGTGNTFSTSGKAWRPFRFNPKLAARAARLRRLKAKGLLTPQSKAQMRAQAAALLAQSSRKA